MMIFIECDLACRSALKHVECERKVIIFFDAIVRDYMRLGYEYHSPAAHLSIGYNCALVVANIDYGRASAHADIAGWIRD